MAEEIQISWTPAMPPSLNLIATTPENVEIEHQQGAPSVPSSASSEPPTGNHDTEDILDFTPFQDNPDAAASPQEEGPANILTERSPPKIHTTSVGCFGLCYLILFAYALFLLVGYLQIIWPGSPSPRPPPRGPPPPNSNYHLNFPEVYPPLDINRSTVECREAWETITDVPCHEGIWLRDWDAGIPSPTDGTEIPDIDEIIPLLCEETQHIWCGIRLDTANQTLQRACYGENAFMLDGYEGRFNTTLLEHNVQDVIGVLSERYQRTCRLSPAGDAVGGKCMLDLDMRFGILDGLRADGIMGLESFLERTKNKFMRGEAITCSWCTIAWFEEKLRMWKEGNIVKNGTTLSLPEFLTVWEEAGRRCAGGRFEDVYHTAIKSYVAKGLLDPSWLPTASADIGFLIRNGAKTSDYPVPEIINLYSFLLEYINKTADDGGETHLRFILIEEYMSCLDTLQSLARTINFYPWLSWTDIATHVLHDIDTAMTVCSKDRVSVAQELSIELLFACPNFKTYTGAYKYDEDLAILFPPFSLIPLLKPYGTRHLAYLACVPSAPGYNFGGIPCPAIFAQFGMQDWTFARPGENMQEIIRVTRRELLKVPDMPAKLRSFTRPTDRKPMEEERDLEIEKTDWVWNITTGICSDCVWRRFVDDRYGYQSLSGVHTFELAREWILTAHHLRDRCLEVGKEFSEKELRVGDESWLWNHDQAQWDEIFRKDRKGPPWVYE